MIFNQELQIILKALIAISFELVQKLLEIMAIVMIKFFENTLGREVENILKVEELQLELTEPENILEMVAKKQAIMMELLLEQMEPIIVKLVEKILEMVEQFIMMELLLEQKEPILVKSDKKSLEMMVKTIKQLLEKMVPEMVKKVVSLLVMMESGFEVSQMEVISNYLVNFVLNYYKLMMSNYTKHLKLNQMAEQNYLNLILIIVKNSKMAMNLEASQLKLECNQQELRLMIVNLIDLLMMARL